MNVAGTVPGPILFGFVFDKACLLWQEKCDERGSCWIYDNVQLSINLAILGMVVKFMSGIFYFMAYLVYKPPAEELAVNGATPANAVTASSGIQNEGFSTEDYNSSNHRGVVTHAQSVSTVL